MHPRIRQLYRDERGMSFVYVALGMMSFLAASTLAIDVGMFMTARSQTQNAADAGALSGAVALAKNDFNNRTATGPAVLSAINTAQANQVIGSTPSVDPADVTFPVGPTGQSNRVQVFAHRIAMPTIMGGLFGVKTVNVNAVAVAEASPANAMKCVKPFMIPDRWIEKVDGNGKPDGSWTTNSTYDAYTKQGAPLPNPDVYINDGTISTYTGYTTAKDVGTTLTLRAGTGDNINPSFYYSWKMPGDVGGDFYRDNIANCNQSTIVPGTLIIQEPGDKTGPTIQGIDILIDKDPNAYWDTTCKCVKGSAFSTSPRVFPIPLYDPEYYAKGKANGRVADFKIANFLGFFAERPSGNSIPGRITQISGLVDPNAGPAPANLFPTAIRLVQ